MRFGHSIRPHIASFMLQGPRTPSPHHVPKLNDTLPQYVHVNATSILCKHAASSARLPSHPVRRSDAWTIYKAIVTVIPLRFETPMCLTR